MKQLPVLILLLASYSLPGCAEKAVLVGKPGPAVEAEEVVTYYIDRPRCNFETVAHIRVNGGYFSLESMLRNMRRQAAELGASGLYVLQTQQLEIREYLGTAKAIRCLPT
ncbi:MAG: hypothetical protein OEN02_19705 [Gammaproteobacteria bacterium]|nr:hypothetical protein [Gammaproteobacteria bacterium]MDH3534783.1 hypothetical protein [Gammaproteobacteria bacterium]